MTRHVLTCDLGIDQAASRNWTITQNVLRLILEATLSSGISTYVERRNRAASRTAKFWVWKRVDKVRTISS